VALDLLSLLTINECYLNENMNTCIKRIVILLFVATFLAMVGTACNTAHGFGKDVKNAGQSIEDGTK